MGKSQVEAMKSAQQEAAAEVNQPSTKPMSPWSFFFSFFFMVDCQMLHLYFYFFTVTYKSQIIMTQKEMLFKWRPRCQIVFRTVF